MEQRISDYRIKYTLGSGQSGKVKLGENVKTKELAAIKVIKKELFETKPEIVPKIHREIALLRLLDHPHVLRLRDVYESPHHLYIIMEYAEHRELFDYVVSRHSLSLDLGIRLFRQIIYGVEYLHSRSICHRDLKLENLLLDAHNNIKIGDFGFARLMRSSTVDTSCGSPHYAAPEVIKGEPYDGRAADIWSCGVILYVLLSGRFPFEGNSIRQLLAKVVEGQFSMPPEFPSEIKNLISGMLNVDTSQRFTISQIKEHPAFHLFLPSDYIIPQPLPLPYLPAPVQPSTLDPNVIDLLLQIGFCNQSELSSEFMTEGTTMAKVFYSMLTAASSVEELPWELLRSPSQTAENLSEKDQNNFMIPARPTPEYVLTSPFARQTQYYDSPSPENYSVPVKSEWAVGQENDAILSDVIQPCINIELPLEELSKRMQIVLTRMGLEWFHPDDFTIYGHHPDGFFITMNIDFQSDVSLKMNLVFTQAKPSDIAALSDQIGKILSSD